VGSGLSDELAKTISDDDRRILEQCLPYTMTSPQRLLALIDAVRYVVARDLTGAFAECGVWRGGSVLAMILTLQALGVDDRDLHLYDTFEGMTEPTEHDTSPFDPPAVESWREAEQTSSVMYPELFEAGVFGEGQVREVLSGTGYPDGRIRLHRGDILQTVPSQAPDGVALLRLDTDWYESTRHELEHLYPRLAEGGVLIIDDYGHWEGARRATDEYFAQRPLLLSRIDYTGRIAVKA
jgi:hypothetical protein